MIAIETRRQQLRLTQAEFARLLKVSQAIVSMWETGETMPRADKLPEIAKVLKCEISDLFDTRKA